MTVAPDQSRTAWYIQHVSTGRIDGWYFDRRIAQDMFEFFSFTWPGERFVIGEKPADECRHLGNHEALRPYNEDLWARSTGGHESSGGVLA